jgi:predicted ATPase with chaperone activity
MLEISPKLKATLALPRTAADLKIPISLVSDLIYRLLFRERDVSVRRMSEVTRLHNQVLDPLLSQMQLEHLVEIAGTGALGRLSYIYRLTEDGTKRAREAMERSQYVGPAPVDLDTYRRAIVIQTAQKNRILPSQVKHALRELVLPDNFHRRIGPAINAGSSLFIYGPPGNGKTTIAQTVAELLASSAPIWLPYALTVAGQLIQIHDPQIHIPVELPKELGPGRDKQSALRNFDRRWALFKRPGVMVGGEMTMDSLELRYEPTGKFYDAPLQLKANGGMFLIDDLGRQRIRPDELLNRWIVPLESEIDFLRLRTGQTLEVPFRQLIVFSTNLDPADLMDLAFLRRIQMKVEVGPPDEKRYYQIFRRICKQWDFPFERQSFLHLLQKWYYETGRAMQAVHPRDIIRTIISICEYEGVPPRMDPELIDEACDCYFVELDTTKGRVVAIPGMPE